MKKLVRFLTVLVALPIMVFAQTHGVNKFSITNANAEDFKKAKRLLKDYIVYDTLRFKKIDKKIILPTEFNQTIYTDTFLDEDNAAVRGYEYVGQYKQIGFYIVHGMFWEEDEFYLLNKISGTHKHTELFQKGQNIFGKA